MPDIPAITTPSDLSLIFPGKTIESPGSSVQAMYNPATQTYDPTSVTISGAMGPVSAGAVRSTALRSILRSALRSELAAVNTDLTKRPPVKSFFKNSTGRRLSDARVNDPDDDILTNVALIVRLARLCHDYTNVCVARSFGIEHFKAISLVRAARSAGYLD